MRYFRINYKYLSGTWKENFMVLKSTMFPDEDVAQNYLWKKMTWVDKMVVTDVKEISNQQYLKYKKAHSTLEEENED